MLHVQLGPGSGIADIACWMGRVVFSVRVQCCAPQIWEEARWCYCCHIHACQLPATLCAPGMDSHTALLVTRGFGGLGRWGMLSCPGPPKLLGSCQPRQALWEHHGRRQAREVERSITACLAAHIYHVPGCCKLPQALKLLCSALPFLFFSPFPFSLPILFFFFSKASTEAVN